MSEGPKDEFNQTFTQSDEGSKGDWTECRETPDGTKRWYRNGELHRKDGPAVVTARGSKRWFRNGYAHRDDGPAIENVDGLRVWYRDGLLHREDGPAIEYANGTKEWYRDGVYLPPPNTPPPHWRPGSDAVVTYNVREAASLCKLAAALEARPVLQFRADFIQRRQTNPALVAVAGGLRRHVEYLPIKRMQFARAAGCQFKVSQKFHCRFLFSEEAPTTGAFPAPTHTMPSERLPAGRAGLRGKEEGNGGETSGHGGRSRSGEPRRLRLIQQEAATAPGAARDPG